MRLSIVDFSKLFVFFGGFKCDIVIETNPMNPSSG